MAEQIKDGNGKNYYLTVNSGGSINFEHSDTSMLDAFGRLRTSEVISLLDVKMLHDNEPLFIDEVYVGSPSVYNNGDSSVTMNTYASGNYVVRQTKQRANYQAGKTQQIFQTFYNFQSQTNVIKRIGYYSSASGAPYNTGYDGLFLESNASGICVNVMKSGSIISQTYQNNWNIDKLNGSGISAVNVDWSKSQISCLDFQWLGVGRIRWCLDIDGVAIPFHQNLHANNISGTYMTYPNKPLRWEIRQIGSGTGNFTHICGTVGTEGAVNALGVDRSFNLNGSPISAATAGNRYALLGIRLNSGHVEDVIDVTDFNTLATTNDPYYWEFLLNPTVSGTFTYSNMVNSSLDIARGATTGNLVSGGILLDSGYGVSAVTTVHELKTALRLGAKIDGTLDTYVLAVTPLTTNMTIYGSMTARENR